MTTTENTAKKDRPYGADARDAARLMAVQALYEQGVNPKAAALQIDEFLTHHAEEAGVKPDKKLLTALITGTEAHKDELLGLIAAARGAQAARRMEPLLQAILLCGAHELRYPGKTDAPVVIGAYTDLAHAFFDSREPALVNAILDKIAKAQA